MVVLMDSKFTEKDLKKYLELLKDNERISINSQEDVLKQFIVPESDDSKGYKAQKVTMVDEQGVSLKDSKGRDIVDYAPREIQTNRRRVLTPDLTTANWTPWKRETSDEEYCYNLYLLILTASYIMEKDPRIDLNPFINEIHNEIKWFAAVSKARDGIMLMASRTTKVINESREMTKDMALSQNPAMGLGQSTRNNFNTNALDDLTGKKNNNFNGLF